MSKFTVKERHVIATASLEELADICAQSVYTIGGNARFLLSEVAGRFGLPTSGVAIMRLKESKNEPSKIHFWGIPDDASIAFFRGLENREWQPTSKSNVVYVDVEKGTDGVVGELNHLFVKALYITDAGFSVLDGTCPNPFKDFKPLYCLLPEPKAFSFVDAFNAYMALYPSHEVQSMALHGEVDKQYRTLVTKGVKGDVELLRNISFSTRHERLMFKFSAVSKVFRYMVYDVKNGVLEAEPHYIDQRETLRLMADFKTTQSYLKQPLIEGNPILAAQLLVHPKWGVIL